MLFFRDTKMRRHTIDISGRIVGETENNISSSFREKGCPTYIAK